MENERRAKVLRIIKYLTTLAVVAALATALGILAHQLDVRQNELEGLYQKSYFESMEKLNDLELKLSKLQVSNSADNQQTLLSEISGDAAVVEAGLSNLTVSEEDNAAVLSFFNKLSDYCKSLSKTSQTTALSSEQLGNLEKLHTAVVTLRTELQSVEAQILDGGKLLSDFGKSLNFIGLSLNTLNNTSLDVPQLIYDGPFSDGLNDRETKYLAGLAPVSAEEAAATAGALFEGATATLSGESDGDIATYIFQLSGSINGAVQVTKNGNKVALIDIYTDTVDTTIEEGDAVARASQFLQKAGYEGLQAVWVSNNNSTYYINFAHVENDVVHYPDLIKIKVAGDSGQVVGLEARNYIFNHTTRTLPTAISETEARQALSARVEVKSVRLAIIPTEWNSELLSYEYVVLYGSGEYYVYVDATTGEEIKVLKVVEDDGRLIA